MYISPTLHRGNQIKPARMFQRIGFVALVALSYGLVLLSGSVLASSDSSTSSGCVQRFIGDGDCDLENDNAGCGGCKSTAMPDAARGMLLKNASLTYQTSLSKTKMSQHLPVFFCVCFRNYFVFVDRYTSLPCIFLIEESHTKYLVTYTKKA